LKRVGVEIKKGRNPQNLHVKAKESGGPPLKYEFSLREGGK